MIERLIRIALAFAVAFVFSGRMEAAAQHCARLAQVELAAPQVIPAHSAEPCHAGQETGSKAEEAATRHHGKTNDRCDCAGVLKAFAEIGAALKSAHIEPYEWSPQEFSAFASVEPAPDLRPPRA